LFARFLRDVDLKLVHLEREEAEGSKACYTTLLPRSCKCKKALLCFTEHILKWTKNEALLRYATLKCQLAFNVLFALYLSVFRAILNL